MPRQSSAAPCCSLPRGLLAEQNHMLQSVLPLNYDKRRPPTQPRLVPLPQGCTAAGTAGAAASRHHGATSDKLHRGGSRFQRCKCQAEAFAHRWNKHGRFPIKNITTELKSFKPTSPPLVASAPGVLGFRTGRPPKKVRLQLKPPFRVKREARQASPSDLLKKPARKKTVGWPVLPVFCDFA